MRRATTCSTCRCIMKSRACEIGLPPGARLSVLPPPPGGPVVFYGTSIVQGGCASRPGMVHTAILGRRLNREAINLGFSGNGMMEPEVARLMAELDPALYVIDCIPNVGRQDRRTDRAVCPDPARETSSTPRSC